ncbi:MAG: hypothetical protein GY827_10085 [Cytophagales bacterium]|nr:hypothetical protein [Cytophagales bacterium]
MAENTKKGGKGNIIIILVLVAVIGALGYFLMQKQQENEQLTSEKNQTEVELAESQTALESRIDELEQLEKSYAALQIENTALGIEGEELETKIAELKKQARALRGKTKLSAKENRELKRQIAEFKADLLKKDQEIKKLRAEKDSLIADKNELIAGHVAKDSLIKDKDNLIAIASVLKAEQIKVNAIYTNDKEYEKDEYRARRMKKFKVVFKVADNKVADHAKKEICLKIIEPIDKAVLFDLNNGGGSFKKSDGTNDIYTARQIIDFDNSNQEVVFLYEKGSDYEKGFYKFELYGDGHFMGMTQVRVK